MGRFALLALLALVRAQLNADDDEASAGSDPTAPCLGATPMNATCCIGTAAAVMGGIDFVDLAQKVQATDAPAFGSAYFTSTLNGYTFHFKSDANAKAFEADPWRFAPGWGGF